MYKFEVECKYYELIYGCKSREMKVTKRTKKHIWYYYIGCDEIIKSKIKVEGMTECASGFKALKKIPTCRFKI